MLVDMHAHTLLQVLNVGIGNNPCYPYDLCMEAHIPLSADLVSWEQVRGRRGRGGGMRRRGGSS